MTERFVHLDVKSDYSFWHGASKIAHLIKQARRCGMPALAITDTNNMFGAFDFSKQAPAAGVQPIVGAEVRLGYVVEDDKTKGRKQKQGTLSLLVQGEQGYQNLCALISRANRPGDDGKVKGAVKARDLMECSEGLILLSGGQDGVLYSMLNDGLLEEAHQLAAFLQGVYADRFYIQLSRLSSALSEEEVAREKALLGIAFSEQLGFTRADGVKFTGVPLVATTPVRYAEKDRHEAWEILRAVEEGRHLRYFQGELLQTGKNAVSYHMRSAEEMADIFADLPEALHNTVEIARRCAFKVAARQPILPPFDTGAGRNEVEELRHQAREGLEVRLDSEGVTEAAERKRYEEQLDYELKVIEQMGFPGYFLIVSDFMKWARANNIPVGPGRGSGAGSMVAWAMMITDLNPFRFGLIFERFLNPDRVSMPDFDIDFCQDRREEVIRYVAEKYGVEQVAQIANFGEIKSKMAVKDAGRVIVDDAEGGFSFGERNDLTRMIPKKEDSAEPKDLADALASTPELSEKIAKSSKLRLLFSRAQMLEGLYRSQGLHAAGVVIADRPMHELAPVSWDPDTGLPVTQFNMKSAESVGLVKFDFLGLKTLSVIQKAVDYIREHQGVDIDIEAVPMDDPDVYEMLAKGKSVGVFQFESAGMQRVLTQVQPTRIEDLIAVNALYRPGPMEMIPHYAQCKKGEDEPHYPEPVEKTRPFLEETFGIMVYQEQVMQVAQVVAGYSLGQADLLRRAMGKKIKSEMDAQKVQFIKGATERGTPRKAAEDLFHHIEKFASYGFNKSHAAAYAVIAYRTAWLKRHYPAEFFAALLSYETAKPERMALVRDDMEVHTKGRITLLPPDVNRSKADFIPEPTKESENGLAIRFGLNAIKSISGDMKNLEVARRDGPFKDLVDFHKRVGYQLNKTQVERLAEAGAFDALEPVRSRAVSILSWLSKHWKPNTQQNDLFGGEGELTIPDKVRNVAEWGNIADREFRAVGFWFGQHPLDPYWKRLQRSRVKRKRSYLDHMRKNQEPSRKGSFLCGLVEDARIKESRNNNLYLSARLAEKQETYYVTFFSSRDGGKLNAAFDALEAARISRKPVVVEVDLLLDHESDDLRIFGNQVHDIDEFLAEIRGEIHVVIDAEQIILTNEEAAAARSDDGQAALQAMAQATRRRVGEIADVLRTARADDDPAAIPVTLEVRAPGHKPDIKTIQGRYRFTAAVENRLKSTDGVSSIRETAPPERRISPEQEDDGPRMVA